MKIKFWGTTLLVFIMGIMYANAVKVHTIGDSTMANYDESATVTRGWGMYLQQFLQGATVNNRGKGGASTRSFYEDAAYWQSVKMQMAAGDYVFIQFAHNDEKNGGADGDSLIAYYTKIGDITTAAATDNRGTLPTVAYKDYLRKYVNEARAMGCTPILVSPVCRRYFTGDTIRRNGRHDLGDSFTLLTSNGPTTGNKVPADDHSMDYPYQMKLVADELGVPFIDLTTATKELYESYGDAKANELLFDGDGATHFNATGATLVARLCASKMKEQGILSDNVVLTSDLSVSPADADLGEAYKGQTLTKEFSLSGFNLTPEEGTVNISATDGIKVSADKTSWGGSTAISYKAGTLVQTFYAQCTLDKEGVTEGNITITQGSKTINIPVKATAVSMEGGTDVLAYWRLESDASYTLNGPATVVDESWSGMYVQRYSSPNANTVWPDGTGFDATRKTQRNLITGDAWPAGDIDENPTRYIEFGITPNKGTTLKIDSIGMYICGCGGNGMMCHINYSTEPDFANQHTIFAPANMVANNMMAVSAQPVISLDEGDTLRVRVYPWYNNTATGKTICLSDVSIKGKAVDATSDGITSAESNADSMKTKIYDIQGCCRTSVKKGINIIKTVYADGKISTRKIAVK